MGQKPHTVDGWGGVQFGLLHMMSMGREGLGVDCARRGRDDE